MSEYIVSARKYRPLSFDSVVGQKNITSTLKNAITRNKLAHAYLFCGPRGVGKTTCARIFAKTINCENLDSEGNVCNACESCIAFNDSRSVNIFELDAASNNSVDDIRDLNEEVRTPPLTGKYKVYIIDEVHMLSTSAFNAFLKTLEEPPKHVIFILATTERNKIMPTILSRCQAYNFERITVKDTVDHLQNIAKKENIQTETHALNILAQKADGGMRDALSIFDQLAAFTDGNITYEAVIDHLNILDFDYYFTLSDFILKENVPQAIVLLDNITSRGFDGNNILTGLANHWRDLMLCKNPATLNLFQWSDELKEKYKNEAQKFSDSFLFSAMDITNNAELDYKISRNKGFLLQLTIIKLCQINSENSAELKKKMN